MPSVVYGNILNNFNSIQYLCMIFEISIPIAWPYTLERMIFAWWRHQMETFSALLALFAWNSPVTGEFPAQRPVTRSFGVFLDLHLNKPLIVRMVIWDAIALVMMSLQRVHRIFFPSSFYICHLKFKVYFIISTCICYLGPLLLTWFNFNPSMDK